MTHRSQGSWVTCHWEEAKVEEARDGHKRHGKSAWRSLSKRAPARQLTRQACELTTPFLATAHTKTHHTADHSTSPRYSLHFSSPLPIIFLILIHTLSGYSVSAQFVLFVTYAIADTFGPTVSAHLSPYCFLPDAYSVRMQFSMIAPLGMPRLTARCISDAYQWSSLWKIFVAHLL